MGMDVYGNNPTSEKGEYFRNTVWWWHPLATYCEEVCGSTCGQCESWHSNDGDGLDAENAAVLASALLEEIESGRCAEWKERYEEELASLPDEECSICGGTGYRQEPPNVGPGDQKCNGCDGVGSRRPWDTHYPFSVENVQEFAEFLQDCGGFKIC